MNLRVLRFLGAVTAASIVMPFADAQSAEPILRHKATPQRFTTEQVTASKTGLQTWNGQISTASGKTFPYTMVGTDPSLGPQTTTVPVYIVPLILTYSDGAVFDPTAPMIDDQRSALDAVITSPIFQPAPFQVGNVNVGVTQYVDAFQRANFWSSVRAMGGGYHVLLDPMV